MSKKTAPATIPLTFDLFDLPTAQHRAGLAGLILQIDAMTAYRRSPKLIPVIDEEKLKVTPTSATITFTRDSMQGVFDELYAAQTFDQKFPTKKKKKDKEIPEDAIEVVQVKGKEKKLYVYRDAGVRPLASFLSRHIDPTAVSWIELWRRMVWEILRNEQARAPFKQVAHEGSCDLGAKTWDLLVQNFQTKGTHQGKSQKITGALMLGAQADNAEAVPFAGQVDHNLLLHFWQLVVLTFVPQVVNKKEAKVKPIGYVLAIPDVADLVEFRAEFPGILQRLEAKDPKHTPPKARLDLPAQAGLEVLRRLRDDTHGAAKSAAEAPEDAKLARLAANTTSQEKSFSKGLHAGQRRDRVDRRMTHQSLAMETAVAKWGNCVRAVETYHTFKLGNNVKLLSFSRVVEREGLVEDYARIDKNHRSPLFRAGLLRALLEERPWHWGMIELFREYPHHFFLEIEGETPKYLPHFGRDARALFAAHQQEIQGMTSDEMNQDETIKRLGVIVRKLITSYVNRRAAKKLGLDWDDFKKEEGKNYKVAPDPEKFGEQQRRVCDDAFLQIRSRHDEDFVEFFAGSICSVPHAFDSKAGDLPFLMQVLMTPPSRDPVALPARNRDDIKTLAMLALSAYSFNVRKRIPNREGSPS